MRVTIVTPGITVSTDAPPEAADAIQRDALEVRLPPPTGAEAQRGGHILAEWLREQRRRRAG